MQYYMGAMILGDKSFFVFFLQKCLPRKKNHMIEPKLGGGGGGGGSFLSAGTYDCR